ncbi:MAG: ParA family protein [Spirochaetes bacterium]|nr:ParA family protein [Spirochaetota bacterium]
MEPRILCCANQKGGVGKTTTTLALAHVLARRGHEVLVIDLDPNAHATSMLLPRETKPKATAIDLLFGRSGDPVVKTADPKIHLVPGSASLCEFESRYSREPHRALFLDKVLPKLVRGKPWEYVLIDTPSTVGALQYNSVTASDLVIVPVVPEFLALNGFNNLLVSLRAVRERLKKNVKYFVLFTMARPDLDSQKRILEWADAKIKDIHFATHIAWDARFLEASASAMNIIDQFPDSDGALAYDALWAEIERVLAA